VLRPLVIAGCSLLLLLGACSENLGPAPPDGGRLVAVRQEAFAGPRAERTGLAISLAGQAVLVGTDGGVFRFDADRPSDWYPVHGGYLTSDSEARVGVVRDLQMTADGRRIFFRGELGISDALIASPDGGDFFTRLPRPDALLTAVDAIGIAEPGALGPEGAWLTVQGGRAFVRAVGAESWSDRLLPRAPAEVAAVIADSTGRIAVAVAASSSTDWTLWASQGPDADVAETGVALDGPALAIAWHRASLLVATLTGIHDATGQLVSWSGAEVLFASIDGAGSQFAWALVARLADSTLAIATGEGPGVAGQPTALPPGTAAAVIRSGDRTRVLYDDGSTWGASGGVDPYRGVELNLLSLAVRPASSSLAVGQLRTGEIFQGPASDPDAFGTRGTPLRASAPRKIVFDPLVEDALFVGSFGVYRSDPQTATWQERNTGFFSYDPGFFAGPFPVSAFVALSDEDLWVGGINGDGPYRSVNGGQTWQRVHEGLGQPGSYLTEPGLPLVTQVRGFARDQDGRVWMGGFRGGAFRLDPSTDIWEEFSAGLPKVNGVALDSCCAIPGETEVDVRDLAVLGDGTLLAATGWGIYALTPGATRWKIRSIGLFNMDVHRLLRHPGDSATVLAASRGREDAPQWLFLTEDGGRTWFPVDSRLRGRTAVDLAWSDPARMEIVALLEAQGAWRLELDP
jgi:hypothetical protein